MSDSLALRNARRHVEHYTEELDLMQKHQEAMECQDCDDFLQLGIEAFRWIMHADQTMRKSVHAGEVEYDASYDQAFQKLCIAWLQPHGFAERWSQAQVSRGFQLSNLSEYQNCYAEMAAILKSLDSSDESLPDAMAALRNLALKEHLDGQTAEFFPDL